MGRPRAQANEQATVERVLAAAEVEFGRSGFSGARLEDIARTAGIRRPSLLYHFDSKERLYAEVVHRAFVGLGQRLESSMSVGGGFAERLEAMVGGYLQFLDEHSALGAVILREMLDDRGPGREILLGEIVPLLERVERFVRAAGEAELGPDFPVREAILQIVSAALVRSASPSFRGVLWSHEDQTRELAQRLFLGGPRPWTSGRS